MIKELSEQGSPETEFYAFNGPSQFYERMATVQVETGKITQELIHLKE